MGTGVGLVPVSPAGGVPVDEAIAGQVLRVVAAGVEAAVLASQQQQSQIDEVRLAWSETSKQHATPSAA